jgi:hypothetical protein
MSIKDRIKQFIHYQHITAKDFCFKCGLSNGFLTNDSAVGSDKIAKIVEVYPEINLEWLVMGDGPMLNDQVNEEAPAYGATATYMIDLQKKHIEALEQQIEQYKKDQASKNHYKNSNTNPK